MNRLFRVFSLVTIELAIGLVMPTSSQAQPAARPAEPLPSWNDGAPKRSIIEFVNRVTREGGPDFVPVPQRIATFDNDGTLICEQPMAVQAFFVFERVRQIARTHPELKAEEPYRSILAEDLPAIAQFDENVLRKLLATTHSGMTTEEFDLEARTWLDRTRHPRFGQLFKSCVYLPQLELLAYLRSNGFKTFIVSGGGIDFIRGFAESTYGIPPEQVIGSSTKTRFELRENMAVLVKLPELNSVNDKAGKPININLHIGRRPILAFGNSDGDLEMLEFTAAGRGPRLLLLLHHDDHIREYAYDRAAHMGRLDRAWDIAVKRGWIIVNMKEDFKTVFAVENTR